MDELGDNSGKALTDYVNRATNLETDIKDIRVDRKEFVKSGKEKGYPMTEMLALAKQDDDKAEVKAKQMVQAGIVMGKPVFAEQVDTKNLRSELSDADRDAARNLVTEVQKIDEELAALAEDLKQVYKEAKKDGFVIPVLKQIVAMKVDPEKAAQRSEFELVYQKYQKALLKS